MCTNGIHVHAIAMLSVKIAHIRNTEYFWKTILTLLFHYDVTDRILKIKVKVYKHSPVLAHYRYPTNEILLKWMCKYIGLLALLIKFDCLNFVPSVRKYRDHFPFLKTE